MSVRIKGLRTMADSWLSWAIVGQRVVMRGLPHVGVWIFLRTLLTGVDDVVAQKIEKHYNTG